MINKALFLSGLLFALVISYTNPAMAVTPTPTPTNIPSPTPVIITPCPSAPAVPTWEPDQYEITSSDVNAFDCGNGHDGYDHLYQISPPSSGWVYIEARSVDTSLDIDYGFQHVSQATPHETESNIGCWDHLGMPYAPTATPTTPSQVTPNPTSTPVPGTKDEDDYGVYWSRFKYRTYLESGENYYFWVGGHETTDLGDYQLKVYYEHYTNPTPTARPPTPTITPEPTYTPGE